MAEINFWQVKFTALFYFKILLNFKYSYSIIKTV